MKLELLRKAKRESERFHVKRAVTAVVYQIDKNDYMGFEPTTSAITFYFVSEGIL
jgi:hypothetical protein